VGLHGGPHSQVSIIVQLIQSKNSGSGQENQINGRGICCTDHATSSIRKSWH
jgi:hypothetical protein